LRCKIARKTEALQARANLRPPSQRINLVLRPSCRELDQFVVTATLVAPCKTPPLSRKPTKIEKIGVLFGAEVIGTEAAGGAKH
jgi:hypothetical protein